MQPITKEVFTYDYNGIPFRYVNQFSQNRLFCGFMIYFNRRSDPPNYRIEPITKKGWMWDPFDPKEPDKESHKPKKQNEKEWEEEWNRIEHDLFRAPIMYQITVRYSLDKPSGGKKIGRLLTRL